MRHIAKLVGAGKDMNSPMKPSKDASPDSKAPSLREKRLAELLKKHPNLTLERLERMMKLTKPDSK